MKFPELTYVTTCKGRLHHLKQTLPRVVAQGLEHIIVVDFDCPDGTARWVKENFPTVQVIKVENQPQFLHTRACNIGGNAANTRWIAFIDADAVLDNDFFQKVSELLKPGHYYIPDNSNANTWGSCIVERSSFQAVGGYDEAIGNWGGEDIGFYNMLNFIGITPAKYDGDLISSIPHDNDHRMKFTVEKSAEFATQMSVVYEQCKLDAMRVVGGFMPLGARVALRDAIQTALTNARDGNGKSRSFSFQLPPFEQVRPRLGEKRSPVIAKTMTFEIFFRP